MIHVDLCDGAHVEVDLAPEKIKALLAQRSATLWVDIDAPTEEDWRILSEQFDFHPLAIEDAQNQNQRAKVDTYEGYLFLSFHALSNIPGDINDNPERMVDATHEIDVFLGPNYLVTIHQNAISTITETRRRWKRHPAHIGIRPAYLLYLLLDAVVDEYFPAMDAIDEAIDQLEDSLYVETPISDDENSSSSLPGMRPALVLKKRLLLLRQIAAPMRDLLNALLRTDDATLLPAEVRVFYQDVYDHALRIVEQIDLHRDILGGVMDTMMAQASNRIAETSNRLNQVMKKMTAISTILMSAALVSGIYGMNFVNMPELHFRYGYEYSLALMAVIAGGLAIYFRRIRWL